MKSEITDYFFVLNENHSKKNEAAFITMATDLYAIKIAYGLDNLHVVVDTELINENSRFIRRLTESVTLQSLLSVYPKDKNGTYQGSNVSDFLFPIEQAASYYLFNASYAFLNDDNLRFVTFAGELAKKINNLQYGVSLIVPQLKTGNSPHLNGYNYMKMSKANNNIISLSDNRDVVRKKIYKLFDMRSLFSKHPTEQDRFSEDYPYTLPHEFLPFHYVESFFPSDMRFDYDVFKDSRRRVEFRELLTDSLLNYFSAFTETRKTLSPQMVRAYSSQDDEYSRGRVNKALNSLNC
jgi:tryptophanyl-tRNA synthetase